MASTPSIKLAWPPRRATWRRILLAVAVAGALAGCGSLSLTPDQVDAYQTEAEAACLKRRGDPTLIPSRAFKTDGCSLWPDGDWRECCIRHDMDYWCGGPRSHRAESDRTLRECVDARDHPVMATLMQAGVRVFGVGFLPFPWRWGFGWPWPGAHRRAAPKQTE